MDKYNRKLLFTIQEASDLGLGSVRQIRYTIKKGEIQCYPPWGEGTKPQKRRIPQSELTRHGIFLPSAEVKIKLNAAQALELREIERHIWGIFKLKERLTSELWLPPLHYIPARDLSSHADAFLEHTIHWTDSEDGLPIIKLPAESEDNFVCFKQHTEDSELWRYLLEWKRLGGHYVHHRSVLLKNVRGDVQTETQLPTVLKNTEGVIVEGFSRVIFRHLFPQVRPDEKKTKRLTENAISLASNGLWNEAVKTNKTIIKMFPGDINALKRLGKAQMELQRYVSAKVAYSRALEIDNNDPIARKMLTELLQKHPDDNDIARIDGGRYRILGKDSGLWILAVFTDDYREIIASVKPSEIDMIITKFQHLLNKYRSSSEVKVILELRRRIDQLERSLFQELKAITWETLANTRCDSYSISNL